MQYIQACENDKTDNRCNGPVGGDRFWSSESHKSLLLNGRVATESYEMKSVFTRRTLKLRTTENAHIHELGYYVSGALLRKNQIFSFLHVGLSPTTGATAS